MSNNQSYDRAGSRAGSDADDLDVRLARIRDLIEELDRLGLKTIDHATEYAMGSMRCALALKTI